MRTKIIVSVMIAVLFLVGLSIALELTAIKQTDYTFVPASKSESTASKVLANATIGDITCDKNNICKFTISLANSPIPIKELSFKANDKSTEGQIIVIRNALVRNYLEEYIELLDSPTTTNPITEIGGGGKITVRGT